MLRSVVVSDIVMCFFVLGSIAISGTLGKTHFQGDFPLLPSSEQRVSTEQVISRMLSILMTMNEPPFLFLTEKLKHDSTIQAFLHTSQNDILKGNPSADVTELLRKKRVAIPNEFEKQRLRGISIAEQFLTIMRTSLNERTVELSQLNSTISNLSENFHRSTSNVKEEIETLKTTTRSQSLALNEMAIDLNETRKDMFVLQSNISTLSQIIDNSTTNLQKELETLKIANSSHSLNEIKANLNEGRKEVSQLKTNVSILLQIFDSSANHWQKEMDTITFVNKSQFLLLSGTNSLNNWIVGHFVSDVLHHDMKYQDATYANIWKSDHFGEFRDSFISFTQSNVTWRNWIETSFGERILLQVRNLDLKTGDSLRVKILTAIRCSLVLDDDGIIDPFQIYDPFNTTDFLIAELNGQVAHFNITSISYILLVDVVQGNSSGKRNYEIRFDSKDISVPVIYSVTKSIFQRYVSQIMERDCHFLRYRNCTILETNEGSITPPRVNGYYRNKESQTWLIKSGSGKKISLNAKKIELEPRADNVFVYDPYELPKLQVAKWTGSSANQQLVSLHQFLFVDFITDSSITSNGFDISFQMVADTSDHFRNELLNRQEFHKTLAMYLERNYIYKRNRSCNYWTLSEGNVTSTLYPSNYENSRQWLTLIKVEWPKRISLVFDDFSTENCCDILKVYDPYSDKFQVAQLSGDEIPKPIQSIFNILILKFDTDGSVNKKGFFARYRTID